MKDFEREMEMDFEKLLTKFQELNPNTNILSKISKMKKDLQIIYDKYEEIKKDYDNIDALNNPYDTNENENGNQIDYLLIAKMMYYNKKFFNFIPRKIQIISLIYFLEKDKKSGLV